MDAPKQSRILFAPSYCGFDDPTGQEIVPIDERPAYHWSPGKTQPAAVNSVKTPFQPEACAFSRSSVGSHASQEFEDLLQRGLRSRLSGSSQTLNPKPKGKQTRTLCRLPPTFVSLPGCWALRVELQPKSVGYYARYPSRDVQSSILVFVWRRLHIAQNLHEPLHARQELNPQLLQLEADPLLQGRYMGAYSIWAQTITKTILRYMILWLRRIWYHNIVSSTGAPTRA